MNGKMKSILALLIVLCLAAGGLGAWKWADANGLQNLLTVAENQAAAFKTELENEKTSHGATKAELDLALSGKELAEKALADEKAAHENTSTEASAQKTALTESAAALDAEKTAHAATKTALDAEKTAHAATKTALDDEKTAHAATKTALDDEKTAHADAKNSLADAANQLTAKDEEIAALYAHIDEGHEAEQKEQDVAPVTADLTNIPIVGQGAEPDLSTIVATVGDENITYGDVRAETVELVPQYEGYYDFSDPASIKSILDAVLDYQVTEKLTEKKAQELGFDKDESAYAEQADMHYAEAIDSVAMSFIENGSTEEEARAAAEEYLAEYGYTKEYLMTTLRSEDINDMLWNHAAKDVAVDDAAIQAAYDERIKSAEATYAQDPTSFESDALSGAPVYYFPEGYRAVRHVFLAFGDDDQTPIYELFTQRDALPEGDAGRAELQKQIDEIAAGYVATAQTIIDEYNAGTDFDSLITTYGQDPGMEPGGTPAGAYFVSNASTSFVDEFTRGAMSIGKIGDVSEPVVSSMGVHIIRYEYDLVPGAVSLETVKDALTAEVLDQKKAEAYDAALASWKTEMNVQVYPEKLTVN